MPSVLHLVVPGSGSVATALAKILELCSKMAEGQDACRHLHARLQEIRTELQSTEERGQLPSSNTLDNYAAVVSRCLQILQRFCDKNLVFRLLKHQEMMEALLVMNEDVGTLLRTLNLAATAAVKDWKQQWETDRRVQEQAMAAMAEEDTIVLRELQDMRAQVEAVLLLRFEIEQRPARQSRAMMEVIKTMLRTVARASQTIVTELPPWFLPPDEVKYASNPFARGPFGSIEAEFNFWHQLNHPNVMKMLGASHVSLPPFVVCEEAGEGDLRSFLHRSDDNHKRLWLLLQQAALGLDYIHTKRMVHRDLKLSNILVGADGQAKLADFGLSACTDSQERLEMYEANGVRVLSDVVKTGGCYVAQLYALESLSWATSIDSKLTQPEYEVLRDCVRAATTPELESMVDVLLHVNDANRVGFAREGAISPLVALVRAGTDEQKQWAACALGILARIDSNRATIAREEGVLPRKALYVIVNLLMFQFKDQMARYEPPEWGLAGRNAFGISLEVVKSGVLVETLALPLSPAKSCVVAGRMAPLCDLELAHPSISRVHAALQFDAHGALFLCDLHSTHGCFVNKKRVASDEFVRLHIGDVLGFGESSRLYAVCGPPELLPVEYESSNLTRFRDKAEKKRAVREEQKTERDRGASWGFGEDAEEEEEEEADSDEEDAAAGKEELPDYLRNLKEDEQPYKSSVSQSGLNEKDQRLFQQLQTRIRKMENLKLERSRILAKQHQLDGLTEGQQRQLDRNEQRIDALMKEIDKVEAQIHAKNAQRSQTSASAATGGNRLRKRNVNEELYAYDSDEDDFYDRTQANLQKLAARKQQIVGSSSIASSVKTVKPAKSEVLTVDSIQSNITRLERELQEVKDQFSAASSRSNSSQATLKESKQEEEADSLDSFMVATTSQLQVNEMDAIAKRKAEVEKELRRQRQLLAVATPALAALPVYKSPVKSTEADTPKVPASPVRVPSTVEESASEKVKPSQTKGVEAAAVHDAREVKEDTGDTDKKRSKPTHAAPKRVEAQPSPKKKRRLMGPTLGPPPPLKVKSSASDERPKGDASVLEGGDRVWVPPSNQTGDGRTKLNEKFGY
ncbi:hypothetical protein BBJ28_00013509 [Nothophytophthora sp. Chile5]|nr:hypothetical protein BBJ28_00013509 [Nothophytophthora sp. Chile5]